MRPPPPGGPQRHDPPLPSRRQPGRRDARARGTACQRLPRPVSTRPSRCGRRRDLEPLRSSPQRPAVVNDQGTEASTPLRRQGRVSVRHEDLRGRSVSVVTHIVPEVFAHIRRSQRVGEEQLAIEFLCVSTIRGGVGDPYRCRRRLAGADSIACRAASHSTPASLTSLAREPKMPLSALYSFGTKNFGRLKR